MTATRLMRRFPALQTYIANPVVVRDLRAQMRGTKSYWYQGGYLMLLGLLAVAGYAQATGQGIWTLRDPQGAHNTVNIVQAQNQLENFYYFIFMTLAALISLIAPALTASSIVGERQRLSLDLLITTPLTAAQLLVGKLVSSIAFLGLLLALSLPASALCIMLGGATLNDVFRAYFTLAVDGLVLAAIGLYFSCAVRVPLLAMVWTYATVVAYLYLTFQFFGLCDPQGTQPALMSPLSCLARLNPFIAVLPVTNTGTWFGFLPIPISLMTTAAAALLIRLLVTAATYRLAVYGGGSAPSLRRQALLISGIVTFILAHDFQKSLEGTVNAGAPGSAPLTATYIGIGLVGLFLAAMPFLPGLFVPASGEDAPPGIVESAALEASEQDTFNARRMFSPEHAGALPLYMMWVVVTFVSVVLGLATRGGTQIAMLMPIIITTALYHLALGFLFWAVARFSAGIVRGIAGARAVALGIFLFVSCAPLLLLGLIEGNWMENSVTNFWLFRPMLYALSGTLEGMIFPMVQAGLLAVVLGASFFVADRFTTLHRERTATP
jgi:hypothetical protein